jgi:hypothetical protein
LEGIPVPPFFLRADCDRAVSGFENVSLAGPVLAHKDVETVSESQVRIGKDGEVFEMQRLQHRVA